MQQAAISYTTLKQRYFKTVISKEPKLFVLVLLSNFQHYCDPTCSCSSTTICEELFFMALPLLICFKCKLFLVTICKFTVFKLIHQITFRTRTDVSIIANSRVYSSAILDDLRFRFVSFARQDF